MSQLSVNFADALSPLFEELNDEEYPRDESMIPKVFDMVGTNGRNTMPFSNIGTLPNQQPFTGQVPFEEFFQGYDTVITPLEFAQGVTVEKKLFDDDQYEIFSGFPRQLRASDWRTRETYGARIFNMGFSADSFFYNNSEGVSLFSDSHTTTASGTSTSIGFDNKITSALSATAVRTARILARTFRGDRAEHMSVRPDVLLIPSDLYGVAHEIVESAGRPDDGTNASNVHAGKYEIWEWQYLDDASTTNWFLLDKKAMKDCLKWTDRVTAQFGSIEDFETLVAKYRCYSRYGNAWINWRFGVGAQV